MPGYAGNRFRRIDCATPMRCRVTLKNYRCFPDAHPCRLDLREGFTGLVGANNSGKSSLLRFFYEFRGAFA